MQNACHWQNYTHGVTGCYRLKTNNSYVPERWKKPSTSTMNIYESTHPDAKLTLPVPRVSLLLPRRRLWPQQVLRPWLPQLVDGASCAERSPWCCHRLCTRGSAEGTRNVGLRTKPQCTQCFAGKATGESERVVVFSWEQSALDYSGKKTLQLQQISMKLSCGW